MTTTNAKANVDAGAERIFGNLMPDLDFGAAMALQQKNVAALVQINELALTGAQEMQRHQVELVKQTVNGLASLFGDIMQPSLLSHDWLDKQAETSKKALALSMAHAREINELFARTNSAAFSILSQRMSEGLSAAAQR